MPQQQATSLTGCKEVATLVKAFLANSVVKLFKSGFSPTPANVKADFQANECDFDGYASNTITAWGDIVLAPANAGYLILAPVQTFLWALVTDAVGNSVGGFWIESSGGILMMYQQFATPVPMTGPDMATAFTPIWVAGAGLTIG